MPHDWPTLLEAWRERAASSIALGWLERAMPQRRTVAPPPPAEAVIAETERRLGRQLPPSLARLYQFADGWDLPAGPLNGLRSVSELTIGPDGRLLVSRPGSGARVSFDLSAPDELAAWRLKEGSEEFQFGSLLDLCLFVDAQWAKADRARGAKMLPAHLRFSPETLVSAGAAMLKSLGANNVSAAVRHDPSPAVKGAEPGDRGDEARILAALNSLAAIAVGDPELEPFLPADGVKRRWFGQPPASDAQIAAAEQRLGCALPESYRSFLKVANGWAFPSAFVARLLPVEEIAWLRDRDPELIDSYLQSGDPILAATRAPSRLDDLRHCLLISGGIPALDSDMLLLLNLASIADGECEAWKFAHWIPGEEVEPDFITLLERMVEESREFS